MTEHTGNRDHSARPPGRDTGISLRNLTERAPAGNSEPFQIMSPPLQPSDLIVHGRMHDHEGLTGLKIHATDTVEIHDLVKEWIMRPSLVVAITLEGSLTVALEDKEFTLGGEIAPVGQFWNLTQPAKMRRISRKGTHIRKALIVLPQEWLQRIARDSGAGKDALPGRLTEHLAIGCWKPSRHALSLAEQLINPGADPEVLQVLSREGRAMEIIREAIASLSEEKSSPAPTTRSAQRAQKIRQHILDHLEKELTLSDLSRTLGMSVASMQKAFKQTYRQTIVEFSREQKLLAARRAIELEGRPVSEAAYRVGYDNPASFSTAFRRRFGFPPSGCKD